jgi:hypothetical protein
MNLTTWQTIRQQVYDCLQQRADALFSLSDALLSEPQAQSLPELSLSPFFERTWSSVYAALDEGRMDVAGLRRVWAEAVLSEVPAEQTIWLGVDSSNLARPDAQCSEDRGMIYVHNVPHASKPVSIGWQFSTLMLLPNQASSWVAVLDQQRIGTEQRAIDVAIAQLRAFLPHCQRRVILLADRWYAVLHFVQACQELHCPALLRLKRNRKLYRRPAERQAGQRGAPRKHGPLLQGSRPETLEAPDARWEGEDEQGKRVVVSCWQHLHFQEAVQTEVCVLRVQREAARGSKRDPKESWFVWTGHEEPPLQEVRGWYQRRFSHEHGYRLLKQALLWDEVRVRTPEQMERWNWIVACACNQLWLAHDLGQAVFRPWERQQRRVTPQQVRRAMPSLLLQLGTPVRASQPRGKSPGWPKGRVRTPASRFPVVKKRAKAG